MDNRVRAKFTCEGVEKKLGWNGQKFVYTANFRAVYDGSEENKQFFAATPAGQISLSTLAIDTFEVGKEYYIDFTPAS